MAREIRYYQAEKVAMDGISAKETDSYKDKLLKLIPAEVVAGFLTLKGILDAAAGVNGIVTLQWIVFIGLLILTPFIYRVIYHVKDMKQQIITTAAFVIWVFTIGGPLDRFFMDTTGTVMPIKGIIASVVIVFYSMLVPLLLPAERGNQ